MHTDKHSEYWLEVGEMSDCGLQSSIRWDKMKLSRPSLRSLSQVVLGLLGSMGAICKLNSRLNSRPNSIPREELFLSIWRQNLARLPKQRTLPKLCPMHILYGENWDFPTRGSYVFSFFPGIFFPCSISRRFVFCSVRPYRIRGRTVFVLTLFIKVRSASVCRFSIRTFTIFINTIQFII